METCQKVLETMVEQTDTEGEVTVQGKLVGYVCGHGYQVIWGKLH